MAKKDEFQSNQQDIPVNFPGGSTSSDPIHVGGLRVIGIAVPKSGGMTGATAGFKVKVNGLYVTLYTASADYTVSVAAEKFVPIIIPYLAGAEYITVVSSATEAEADNKAFLVCRPV